VRAEIGRLREGNLKEEGLAGIQLPTSPKL